MAPTCSCRHSGSESGQGGLGGGDCRYQPKLNQTQCNWGDWWAEAGLDGGACWGMGGCM